MKSFILGALALASLNTAVASNQDQCPQPTILVRTCACVSWENLYIPTLQILKSNGDFTSANLGDAMGSDDCALTLSQSVLCK